MSDLHSTVAKADQRILLSVRRYFADEQSVTAARALSWYGGHATGWLAIGLAGAARDRERCGQWLRATGLVASAHLASMVVKQVVRRPRPQVPGLEPLMKTASKHSFPSSHAASAAAAAVSFGSMMPVLPLRTAAAALCFSRLVVGVHFPSDVVVGAAMGAAVAQAGQRWVALGGRCDG
ncbi:phosphatase PAP2 family protein [Streptomyces albireticuli]|uniref:Phosphatase PAP2 family protein n=1 Tax=Streptomyces albireticuli TaxID=1940 RepID=A0A2A2D0J5_9ACTN|nr:phosphatase PAP2 family protein [Streptomyces albireticuli]MCD9146077.1 phosphatase PAP2 family protein [Streptomyces albireticuli]MCD9166255.1 phosphatase PAP2 family protein [Streptomyces albireticuli]MCD9196580.1 phosphatase PAP2 family protein [Streptomyces albireticuli]PAU45035.1 phosphatase PAP2 family protein [Streptomyces albireticuli]